MSEHKAPETTNQSQSLPCIMGCGFFGSNATGDCCSKCYRELQAKETKESGTVKSSSKNSSSVSNKVALSPRKMDPASLSDALSSPKHMDIESSTPEEFNANPHEKSEVKSATLTIAKCSTTADFIFPSEVETEPSVQVNTPKKKKKKASYKSMMAGMMSSSDTKESDKQHVDKIRSNTGGGAFSKVDKI